MIRVSLEVRNRAVNLRVTVWARSIERAVSMAEARYPGCQAQILFPIEPEFFCARESAPQVEMMSLEASERVAG